ncbi:hypothetical protein [Dactylosporangium darangshiense]|uniref:hypothetical protein n=1 Tax=Dactylosporangium darangshiense TaxID=579108 RepID=UPI0031E9C098
MAVEAGVGRMTIYRWLDRARIALRPHAGASLSRDWLAEQYAIIRSVNRIARLAGVSPSTVRDSLSRYGLLPPPTDERAPVAAARYLAGHPLTAVAEELQMSRRVLTCWLRAMQVPIHPPGRRRRPGTRPDGAQ